ncbi:MAG: alpha-mannosidase, partial [Acidimicrobiales bacterium]
MPVGYLPDMFGHIAQMPRLLRLAGLTEAVVWRGVPARIDRHTFTWSSPGGASVRAEYLPVGYSAGAALPLDADQLVARVEAYAAEVGALYPDPDQPILLMAGGDHQLAGAGLPASLDKANRAQEGVALELCSLPAYLAARPEGELPAWEGELRSGARANLLMGVASNRVDVKQAAARAERALERLAEPLAATWLPPERWPGAALAAAWRLMVLNSAHDSICACSADTVGLAVLERYAEATAIAEGVTAKALAAAAAALPEGGAFAVNPCPVERGGLLQLNLPAEVAPPGFQLVSSAPGGSIEVTGRGGDLARLLGELTAGGWLADGRATAAEVRAGPEGVTLDMELDPSALRGRLRQVDQAVAEAWAQAGAHRDDPLTVRVTRRPVVRVAARVAGVPGLGWAPLAPDLDCPPVEVGPLFLDNGLARVELDPETGTFSVGELAGFDRLVDGGDAGDTYNYSPPDLDALVEKPTAVLVQSGDLGPVRGTLLVTRDYLWPAALCGQRRDGAVAVRVTTTLELRAGEELVRVTTRLYNAARDHRLRAHFPLPEIASSSRAECAFAVVERGLQAEGGPGEHGLATFPSRRFVCAGGLFLTHEGLLEYEVVGEGRELALTLLRCTGVLSRPAPAWRPNAAGPALPLEGPQMQGPITLRYAVSTRSGDPYALAEQASVDLLAVAG